MNIKNSVIIDNTSVGTIVDHTYTPIDILEYCAGQNIRIVLENDGNWVKASLVGVYIFNPSTCEGHAYSSDADGYGHTKEEALLALARRCSGCPYSRVRRQMSGIISLFCRRFTHDGYFPTLTFIK